MDSFKVWHVESELFVPVQPDPAKQAGPLRLVTVPGLPIDQVQFFRLFVSVAGGERREHIVLSAHFPRLGDELCDEIVQALRVQRPAAVLSFTREVGEGRAVVRAHQHSGDVAAAVAEVLRAYAWDESPVFRIQVQSQSYEVSARWEADHADVSVRETSREPPSGVTAFPKKYTGRFAPLGVSVLVDRLVPGLIAGEHPALGRLREQFRRATIREVEMTGHGFFVDFDIPADVPLAEPASIAGGSAEILIEGVASGAGCVLFVREGRLATLEGYVNGDDVWAEDARVLSIENIKPVSLR